jgi:hypothetical protein
MASILGSCGCGCGGGGGCKTVENNCTFTLRRFDNNIPPDISWNEDATDNDKACWESNGGPECYDAIYGHIYFESGISFCTGEGIVIRVNTRQDTTDPGNSLITTSTLVGTYNVAYQDENISLENIGEVDLTEEEKAQKNPPCKFSYNFKFTPEDGVEYVVLSLPCGAGSSYYEVSLEQDGRAYFLTHYDETTKKCTIRQTYITEAPFAF